MSLCFLTCCFFDKCYEVGSGTRLMCLWLKVPSGIALCGICAGVYFSVGWAAYSIVEVCQHYMEKSITGE